jgi:hypothetical protein
MRSATVGNPGIKTGTSAPEKRGKMNREKAERPPSSWETVALGMIDEMARRFPVCLSSDEFHFFPQAVPENNDRLEWDDFSPESVSEMVRRWSRWETRIEAILALEADNDNRLEAAALCRLLRTLREQFELIRPHETQPTFLLTVAAIGLAEALEIGSEFRDRRLAALPKFLDRAGSALLHVPTLYLGLGLDMAARLKAWWVSLQTQGLATRPALEALERFGERLQRIPTVDGFRVAPEIYERIAEAHIDCRMGTTEILEHLNCEIRKTLQCMKKEADTLSPGDAWQTVLDRLPVPETPRDGLPSLYRSVIDRLSRHCAKTGMADPDLLATCPVAVQPVPEHLLPVRSAAAYSMAPGHPPRGGTFFIPPNTQHAPRDLWLLSAHETYPGHHLLDNCRWGLHRPVRRHLEFPIFYEGWASFSEELMFETGFFQSTESRFLMAKRRYWRAVRGKTDLLLHSGRNTLEKAAGFLVASGMDNTRAASMARRYTLKPGYQLSYTMGRRMFRRLYDRFMPGTGNRASEFARRVLQAGEVGLEHLKAAD